MTETPVSEMTFEAAMKELENVVNQLEGAQVPLEDSIRLYERGEALKKHCDAKLQEAEEKVAQITRDAEGHATGTKPVESL